MKKSLNFTIFVNSSEWIKESLCKYIDNNENDFHEMILLLKKKKFDCLEININRKSLILAAKKKKGLKKLLNTPKKFFYEIQIGDFGEIKLVFRKSLFDKLYSNFNLSFKKNYFSLFISGEPDWMEKTAVIDFTSSTFSSKKNKFLISCNEIYRSLSNDIYTLTNSERFNLLRTPRLSINDTNPIEKTKLCSFLSSKKNMTSGHFVRNLIFKKITEDNIDFVDIYPSKYFDFSVSEFKLNPHYGFRVISLMEYKFTIIIENSFSPYHLSEQIKDAILLGVVPIYIGNGSSDLKILFEEANVNQKGLILLEEPFKIFEILNKEYLENFYKTRHDIISSNRLGFLNFLKNNKWDGLERDETSREKFVKLFMSKLSDYLINKF